MTRQEPPLKKPWHSQKNTTSAHDAANAIKTFTLAHHHRINMIEGTEKLVCQDIEARQQLGLKKYGTSVENNPLRLREWLEHAYQEALDLSIYLRRAMQELDK